jgi:ribonuclease Y
MEIIWVAVGLLVGVGAGYALRQWHANKLKSSAEHRAKRVVEEAQATATALTKEASVKSQAELLKAREALENEIRNERNELKAVEKRLTKREDNLDRKVEMLDEKEAQLRNGEEKLEQRQQAASARESEIAETIAEQAQLAPDAELIHVGPFGGRTVWKAL